MSVSSLKREEILKWHRSKAATPEYTAKLLGVPLDEVLYIIAHPETPAPHKDDFHARIHRTIALNSAQKH